MEEETPCNSETLKQFRISENKRVRIVYDPNPIDPRKEMENPDAGVVKFWEDGKVYGTIYETLENEDDWIENKTIWGFYGLKNAEENIES